MDRGWIKLWRKLLDSEIFQNEGLLKVAVWALLKANHKEVWVPVKTGRGETIVHLKPGEFIFGRHTAAIALSMKPSTVRNRVAKLQQIGFLKINSPQTPTKRHFTKNPKKRTPKKDTHYSIGTIINWELYQPDEKEEDRQEDNQRTTKGHRQELKEVKGVLHGKKARRAKPNPDVKKFIEWWCETFKAKFNTKYLVNGKKEGATIKRLLSIDPYENLVRLAEKFFHAQDSFIKDAGYTIGVFSSQINKLKSQEPQRHDRYAT